MEIKVTTSCTSRFFIFDQARQLHRHGMLHRLITNYPKFKTREWGIPDERVVSRLGLGIYQRATFKGLRWVGAGLKSRIVESMQRQFSSTLSQYVPPDTDIFIGLASFMLEAVQWARAERIVSIVVNGGLHERTVQKTMLAECEKFGFAKSGNPQFDWLIEKQDAEFEEANYIFVNSNLSKKTMIQEGVPESKIIANFLGVDLSMFSPGQKNDTKFRIIYCSGMKPLKGVHYLLRAFDELALPQSELWLVGSAARDARMKAILREHMSDNIFIKGTFPLRKLKDIYNQGSVFVMPSLADGIGSVVLEAMACGLPVIVSDRTGSVEAVSDGVNGFIVPAQSVEALKEKILFLYENRSACVEMGRNALDSARKGFSWDDYGDRLKNIMQQCVAR